MDTNHFQLNRVPQNKRIPSPVSTKFTTISGLAFCFDAFSFKFLDVFLPIAKKKQMNRFRLKFLDVFSLIKTSSKHRKMFLDQKIPPRLEEMDLGDPQGDGGGDLEISPLSLAIFVLMAEQERAVGKWEKERMGESAVYSMSSMDMCVYLELICICVCIYIYM